MTNTHTSFLHPNSLSTCCKKKNNNKKNVSIIYRTDVNVTSRRTEKTRNPWTLEGANNICCGSFKCDLPRSKLSGSTEAFPLFKRANKEH